MVRARGAGRRGRAVARPWPVVRWGLFAVAAAGVLACGRPKSLAVHEVHPFKDAPHEWTAKSETLGARLTDVTAWDAKRVAVRGVGGYVAISDNGGESWTELEPLPKPNNANVPYRPLFGGSLAGGSPDRLVALSPSGREVYIHGDPPGGWRMMDVRCPSYPDRGISALMSTERGIVSVINPNPGSAKRAASLCSTDSGSEVQNPLGTLVVFIVEPDRFRRRAILRPLRRPRWLL